MSSPTLYRKGDWKAVCDGCGQRFLASALRKRWDGLMVCSKDYETRQPQDFVRAKIDIQAVPFTRPESTEYTYLAGTYSGAIAGYAVAGQAISGFNRLPDLVPTGSFTL